MWILILLICFLPVSGALWAEKYVRGVVGRAITIDCHYEAKYRSHTKYWCHGWTRQCSVLVETNGQHGRSGRVSITDNPEWGIFTVTMEDLRSKDTGWYRCGIKNEGPDPLFSIHLHALNECVSGPVLRFLPSANALSFQNSLSVTCESVKGSLPIRYAWYGKTQAEDTMISNSNTLDLHCQSFNHQQYYCTASNYCGTKLSEILDVTASNVIEKCTDTSDTTIIGSRYSCESSGTESAIITPSTNPEIRDNGRQRLTPIIVLSVTGVLAMVFLISLIWFLSCKLKDTKFKIFHRTSKNETQEATTSEEQGAYAAVLEIQSDKTPAQLANKENEAMDAAMEFQRKSTADPSVNGESNVIYTDVKFINNPPKVNRYYPTPGTPENSTKTIYASIAP